MAKKARHATPAPQGAKKVPSGLSPAEAKQRLDRLIGKTRDAFYKPIAIAEILFRSRTESVRLGSKEDYRRKSDKWAKAVARDLWGAATASNARYWDQMFDDPLMTPAALVTLGAVNASTKTPGLVETYIYAHLHEKLLGISQIIAWVSRQKPKAFQLAALIDQFVNDDRYARSVDKVYEVVVYALFEVVTRRLGATVSIAIDPASKILKTFDDFALMVLGVNSAKPKIEQPAKLYRVGRANASDGGLDMWGNFGPAVQVKHISLTTEGCEEICEKIYADKIIIVCKDAAADVVSSVLTQVGLGDRIRGIIPESLLCGWYENACNMREDPALGEDLLKELVEEMSHEFSTSHDAALDKLAVFSQARGYRYDKLPTGWDQLWQAP